MWYTDCATHDFSNMNIKAQYLTLMSLDQILITLDPQIYFLICCWIRLNKTLNFVFGGSPLEPRSNYWVVRTNFSKFTTNFMILI